MRTNVYVPEGRPAPCSPIARARCCTCISGAAAAAAERSRYLPTGLLGDSTATDAEYKRLSRAARMQCENCLTVLDCEAGRL